MTDIKHTQTTPPEDRRRLFWKVSPITGREYYDYGAADNYYLNQMLDQMDREDEERKKAEWEKGQTE